MFGVVPKTIWQRTNPADEQNRIDLAARCLLIASGNRLILVDTGMGDKQSEKFFSHYGLYGDATLENSILAAGFHPDQITDVLLTHLHFDHVGGAIVRDAKGNYQTRFRNATYWTHQAHWNWRKMHSHTKILQKQLIGFSQQFIPSKETHKIERALFYLP